MHFLYQTKEINQLAIFAMINKNEKYEIKEFNEAIGTQKTYLCNFYQLKNPIIDEYDNKFWNSEGYYMSLRTNNLDIKKKIAEDSIKGGITSRNARKLYKLDTDENHRVEYMEKTIHAKFEANSDLKKKLLTTKGKQIIEKNYWYDDLFGVRTDTLQGANFLGKLLMKYRDES